MKIRKMNNHNLAVEVERTASLDEFKWRVYSRIDGTCVQYSDRVWEPVLEWKPVTVNASSSGFSYKYGRCYLGEGGFIEVSLPSDVRVVNVDPYTIRFEERVK